jgi:hypothetical protein
MDSATWADYDDDNGWPTRTGRLIPSEKSESITRPRSLIFAGGAIVFYRLREGHAAFALIRKRVQLAIFEWLAGP